MVASRPMKGHSDQGDYEQNIVVAITRYHPIDQTKERGKLTQSEGDNITGLNEFEALLVHRLCQEPLFKGRRDDHRECTYDRQYKC